jgi:hypothetical protein
MMRYYFKTHGPTTSACQVLRFIGICHCTWLNFQREYLFLHVRSS